jgi:hypothetical protein
VWTCLFAVSVVLVAHEVLAQTPLRPRPPTIRIPQTDATPILIEPDKDPPDPLQTLPFILLDRFNAVSAVGAELTSIDFDGEDSNRLFRGQVAGRYVDPDRRLGGYLQLPFAFLVGAEDTAAVGNLELGGILLRPKVGGPTHAFVFHGGVTLPTGSVGKRSMVNARATVARPADAYLMLPGATSLRAGASSVFHNGHVFGRLDLGFDVNFDVRHSGRRADPLVHVNVGFGVDLGRATVFGEVSNAYVIDTSIPSHEDRLTNVAAISLRIDACRFQPYLSFLVPFDGDSTEILDTALTIGLEAKL